MHRWQVSSGWSSGTCLCAALDVGKDKECVLLTRKDWQLLSTKSLAKGSLDPNNAVSWTTTGMPHAGLRLSGSCREGHGGLQIVFVEREILDL